MIVRDSWIQAYNDLNNSYKKTLVFRVGADSGFFSEYNNMVFAILYCLKHEIKFVLSSEKNNFYVAKGWEDFFLPFCEEDRNALHSRYNMRGYRERTNFLNIQAAIFKRIIGADFLTQHLWDKFHKQEEIENIYVPILGLTGNLVENCKVIIDNIWYYQPSIIGEIKEITPVLDVADGYVGVHIRGGDKAVEHRLYTPVDYMAKVQEVTSCKKVYVATDDYTNVLSLREGFPEYTFYTNCDVNARGYSQGTYDVQTAESKRKAMLELFVDVDALSNANLFVGTYSSNIGVYMGMRRGTDTCYCLDFDEWRIW